MTKIVINECHGGFGLSYEATKRLAELCGRECYPYRSDLATGRFERISAEKAIDQLVVFYFDVPEYPEHLQKTHRYDFYSRSERNEWYEKHIIDDFAHDRSNPFLVQVVEELGEKANGRCAELKIVEIPDGVDWTIEEYDGCEWIAETHRTWR